MTQYSLSDALAFVFGAEWHNLSASDQQLIERDCIEDGGVSDLSDYAVSIGRGNLDAYARVMRVRFAA